MTAPQATPSPTIEEAPLDGGPAGNVYDKYGSRNPVERRLVERFVRDLGELVVASGARGAHEVGCGEGELSLRLARMGLQVRGSDASGEVIEEARRRAARASLDVVYEPRALQQLEPATDAAELIVCCEVLEHIPDPRSALDAVASLARPWAILSVPREPLWRALNLARVKYVRSAGNTPGHVNHWSQRAFLRFLERRMEIVEVRTPVPWTMVLGRVSTATIGRP